jgi:adenosylmethionine-8-amino-7-oxononanoate aminotransferase
MSNLVEKDLKYIWHPFNHKGTEIVPIVKAEGAYIFDEEGKKYIDGFSSWWVNIHGHCHPYIAAAIAKQALELEHVAFGGFTHPQAVKLAERLVHLLPENINKIFFSDNGSTANEVALKMAIQYWFNQGEHRDKFITFTNDYHGDTFGSMSLTARGGFNEPFERFLFDVEFVDTPNKENRAEVLARFEALLMSNDVAAFIFEPIVQGAAGMLMHSPEILAELIALCQEYNVVTIADEVLTGFYRTGKFFSSDHLAFKPDIICLSKGVTGGFMTMGVTAVADKIFNAFDSENKKHTFLHGHSYTGNALACAAANANLDLFEQPKTLERIQRIVQQQAAFINSIKKHPKLRHARNFGTIAAIELDTEGERNYFNTKGNDAYKWFMDKGIVIRPLGNVLIMIPPYCIKEEDLNYIYEQITHFLEIS